MATRPLRILTALCGILGVAALALYYSEVLIPLPPPNATLDQLTAFASQHQNGILLDAWMQATGSVLTVLFTLALLHLAGASASFWGRITLLASAVLLGVGLSEGTFTIGAVEAARLGHSQTALTCFDLTNVFGHIFLMVPAPLFFISVGAALLGTRFLPRWFCAIALAIGLAFAVLGLLGLFSDLAGTISTYLLIGQELWIAAAAIALALRAESGPTADRSTLQPATRAAHEL